MLNDTEETDLSNKNIRLGNNVILGKNIDLGFNVIIMNSCKIENNVSIGHNCIIYPNTIIKENTRIQDNVVIGKQPKSMENSTFKTKERINTIIGEDNLICTSSIIYSGVNLGRGNILGDSAIIREGSKLGDYVKVGNGSFVYFDAKIGNHVSIQAQAIVGEESILEDHVFIGPKVSMNLDRYMGRKGNPLDPIIIKRGAAIGSSCILLPGVEIGENVLVGAGSTINKSLEGNFVYIGNPPRKFRKTSQDEKIF